MHTRTVTINPPRTDLGEAVDLSPVWLAGFAETAVATEAIDRALVVDVPSAAGIDGGLEAAYRNVGAQSAVIGMGMSGVLDRHTTFAAARLVMFFADVAWALGRSGWPLDPHLLMSEEVIRMVAAGIPPTDLGVEVFTDVASIMRTARTMLAAGWTFGGRP